MDVRLGQSYKFIHPYSLGFTHITGKVYKVLTIINNDYVYLTTDDGTKGYPWTKDSLLKSTVWKYIGNSTVSRKPLWF